MLIEGGEGRHPDEGALELADVGGDARGDVLQDVEGQVEALGGALAGEDRDAGLQVRGLDVSQQAPLEAGAQALVEPTEGLGGLVGGEDHLLARGVQGVEGVEELLEGRLLALEELDVVDQEDVDLAVAALEALHAAVVLVAIAYAGDEVGDEDLGVDVLDADPRVEGLGVVADGVQEVRLAQAGAAVDEQGVVGAGRGLGHGQCGGVGEAVGGSGDVGVEGVSRIELGDVVGRRGGQQPGGVLGAGAPGAVGAGKSRPAGPRWLGWDGGGRGGCRCGGDGRQVDRFGGHRGHGCPRGLRGGVDRDLHGHGAAPDLGDGGADGSTCLLDDVLGEGRSDDEDERAVDVDEMGHADHGHLALPQLSGAGEHLEG